MAISDAVLGDLTFFLMRQEASWAQWSTGNSTIAHPFYGGNYGLVPEDPDRIQPHVDGNLDTTWVVQDTRDVTGPLEVGLYPALAKYVLDWATVRSGSVGESYTCTIVYPGLMARRSFGTMVNSMTLDFSDGDDLRATLELQSKYEEILQTGSIPVIGSFTMPTITSFTFLNCRFLFSLDNNVTEVVPVGLESGQIVYSNNLIIGPHIEDRVVTGKDGTIEYLYGGQKEVSGNVVVLLDRAALPLVQANKYEFSLRLMAAHRSGDVTTATAGVSAAAGPAVSITVADSSDFAVGDVVRFDTANTANRSVATVDGKPDGTHITVDTLDKDVASGDYVYNKALEIILEKAKVTRTEYTQENGDLVKCTLNFRGLAEQSGDVLIDYTAEVP